MHNLFRSKDEFIADFKKKYEELEGDTLPGRAKPNTCYITLILLLGDKINLNWIDTVRKYTKYNERQIYYFSMEFLIGRLLKYYLVNLDLQDMVAQGFEEMGVNYQEVLDQEPDPGIGNGGLGRLAACFLDSMAHMDIAGNGNGMRYRFGLFSQKIVDGYQMEVPDNWLRSGYPWEKCKRDKAVIVKFNGEVVYSEIDGKSRFTLENYQPVLAVPYDVPIVGLKDTLNINNLRLWSAEAVEEEMDMHSFNSGDFGKAMQLKSEVEAISYILYPNDRGPSGRELRLKQEYLLVSAGIQSIIRFQKSQGLKMINLSRKVAIHINDTHPALCVPELMRLLVDEEELSWDQAWLITTQTISYTNHTILPEALEKWSVDLVKTLLPRIYQIIEEIDRRYRSEIEDRDGNPWEVLENTLIIKDGQVNMANLAIIGSYSVNGVAGLHTKILKENVFPEFNRIYPERFCNVTNGVNHRRFLYSANSSLSSLITSKLGEGWHEKAMDLNLLKTYESDHEFMNQFMLSKLENKKNLARYIQDNLCITVNPESIFDIHVKRIHAYKRQLLSAFKIMALYNRLKENPDIDMTPVTFIFAGKAAPGYTYAKATIKLISMLGDKINQDPEILGKLKVVFLENFNVTLGEMIYPAADISEQISTASKEASGTGNMKFMFNGAITLGTLDGANVEILHAVGPENIKIFGLNADEVIELQSSSRYTTREEIEENPRLKNILAQLTNGYYGPDTGELLMIYDSLVNSNDTFFVLKDFLPYMEAFDALCEDYKDRTKWWKMSLSNVASAGVFTSDRSITDYANDIWMVRHK